MSRPGLATALLAVAVSASANTYTVTSTADSGAGSLRQAILDANANPGADTIAFGIVGTGPHTISPASALPTITGPVTIDGYTQGGSSANTNPTTQGLNTVLKIEIDGTTAGSGGCLRIQSDDVTVKGLVINRCATFGIVADPTTTKQNLVVEGCFFGSNVDGTQVLLPSHGSLSATNQQNARIGGTTPAARNLFASDSSGNTLLFNALTGTLIAGNLIGTDITGTVRMAADAGIQIVTGSNNVIGGTSAAARNVSAGRIILFASGPLGAEDTLVQGNFLGLDVTGTRTLLCRNECIEVNGNNNTIGGSAPGAGNRIGGADVVGGILVLGAAHTIIQGNAIGTDETGTLLLGNAVNGIKVANGASDVKIGGTQPGEGNVIAHNGGEAAISVTAVSGVTIRGNSIFDNPGGNANKGLGIDLNTSTANGVTYNDAGDGDTGGNGYQNYPILTTVTYGASTTTVAGSLNSTPATTFDIDFYADPICARRPQDLPEGKTYLGSTQVTTDGAGNATFNEVLSIAVPAGSPVTSTATDPGGNTSEFTPRFVISSTPGSGNPIAAAITLKGLSFESGATVTVGGLPATNIAVPDAHTLTMDTPHLPAGTVNAITVSNPNGGTSGTLPNGFIADFTDVPGNNQFYLYVTRLVAGGITAGIGGSLYGVNQGTLRQQMAVFLLKSKYGVCYTPPPCTGVFPDVPCSSNFATWIEALAAEGVTSGCGGGNYCPTNVVTRQQMAVFLLKAKHGSSFVPPPCEGHFADVPCPSQYADWIEQLQAENITGGCGGQNFCPLNNVTRGQMAAFLVNAFSLP